MVRYSQLGYRLIPDELHQILFPGHEREHMSKLQTLEAKIAIHKAGLKVEDRQTPDICPDIPEVGDVFQHVERVAQEKYGPIQKRLEGFLAAKMPRFPSQIVIQAGWTRYADTISQVPEPLEDEMVCDVETFVTGDNLALMAGALTSQAYYLWLHPALVDPDYRYTGQMVPVGSGKLIVNHFVKFDASRWKETYQMFPEKPNYLFDTMAAHQSCCGMSHKQREQWLMYKNGSFYPGKWVGITSAQSLVDTYNLHVGGQLTQADKSLRDIFVKGSMQEIRASLDDLCRYCLLDCKYTFELAQAVYPKWLKANPSIISFAGHVGLNQTIYPVSEDWEEWKNHVSRVHAQVLEEVSLELNQLAEKTHQDWLDGNLEPGEDPWLCHLDWTPAKSGKTKGMAKWYRQALKPKDTGYDKSITLKSDLAPLLLRMKWLGEPIQKIQGKGWCYRDNDNPEFQHEGQGFRRIPHKKGVKQNCGSPLGKDYVSAWEDETISSGYEMSREILKKALSCAYWTSIQSRVNQYITHPFSDVEGCLALNPHWISTGTSSKRAVEELWLTVSGAKSKVIGSETRSKIVAPPGYRLLLTDFDTQEARIAALYSDTWDSAMKGSFGYGQSPMSYTLIVGDKDRGDDTHSLLAKQRNIPRNLAKNMNFQMIYLCGVTALVNSIRAHDPSISPEEAKKIAEGALTLKRGTQTKTPEGVLFSGGTDSGAYNFMLRLADMERLPAVLEHLRTDHNPRSPLLASSMSQAIQKSWVGDEYRNSRANWGIQTTGVDLLHFFMVALEWLFEHYGVNGRYLLSYHDEIGSIVPEDQTKEGAKCHQIAHLWSWVALVQKLGFHDLPDSWAWFSAVNVDTVYRKEVQDSIVTPSNPDDEPPGFIYKPSECF